MSQPSSTINNASGNLLSSQSLAASGTITFDIDLSAKYAAKVLVNDTGGGTVATTNGVQVDVFTKVGAGPDIDTVPIESFVIGTVVSTAAKETVELSWGRYRVKLTNLDTANAVTVFATSETCDSQ